MLSKISFNNLNDQVLGKLVNANANPSLIRRLPQQFVLNVVATVTATGGLVQNTIELVGRTVMAPVAYVIPSQKLRATINKQNLVDTAKKVAGFVPAILTSLLGIIGFSNMNARLQFSKFGTSSTEPKVPVRQIVALRQRVDGIEAGNRILYEALLSAVPGFATVPEVLNELVRRLVAVEGRPAAEGEAPVDLSGIEGRIAALEGRPVGAPTAPVDLSGIEGRIAALEGRPVAAPAAPVDLSGVEGRLAALEGRPVGAPAAPVDLSGVEARIAALESRPVGAPAAPADLSGVEARIADLEGRPIAAPAVVDLSGLEGRVTNLSTGFEEGRRTIESQAAIIATLRKELDESHKEVASTKVSAHERAAALEEKIDALNKRLDQAPNVMNLHKELKKRIKDVEEVNKIHRTSTLDTVGGID